MAGSEEGLGSFHFGSCVCHQDLYVILLIVCAGHSVGAHTLRAATQFASFLHRAKIITRAQLS